MQTSECFVTLRPFDDIIGPDAGTFVTATRVESASPTTTATMPTPGDPATAAERTATPEIPAVENEVAIDVIHDGFAVPEEIGELGEDARADLEQAYSDDRDWGAHYIATALARKLGIPSYLRVTLLRPLLDCNRFAGVHETPLDPEHRLAIAPPMAQHLDSTQRRLLLEEGYDRVDADLRRWVHGKRIKLAIHTYRPDNAIGTRRPAVSLILRSPSYDRHVDQRLTTLFEIYPRELAEFTADRILAYHLAATLERRSFSTGFNSPYLLPDGAVEMRLQLALFFLFLREKFEREHGPRESAEYDAVWRMLSNLNRRSAEGIALLELLQMGAKDFVVGSPPYSLVGLREIYDEIRTFLESRKDALVQSFRFHPSRMSALTIEVRRDVFLRMERDAQGRERPAAYDPDRVEELASGIAEAVRDYLREDLPRRQERSEQIDRSGPVG